MKSSVNRQEQPSKRPPSKSFASKVWSKLIKSRKSSIASSRDRKSKGSENLNRIRSSSTGKLPITDRFPSPSSNSTKQGHSTSTRKVPNPSTSKHTSPDEDITWKKRAVTSACAVQVPAKVKSYNGKAADFEFKPIPERHATQILLPRVGTYIYMVAFTCLCFGWTLGRVTSVFFAVFFLFLGVDIGTGFPESSCLIHFIVLICMMFAGSLDAKQAGSNCNVVHTSTLSTGSI